MGSNDTMRRFLGLVLLGFSVLSCNGPAALSGEELSDSAAKKAIEADWAGNAIPLRLGQVFVSVLPGNVNVSDGILSEEFYKRYTIFQDLGVITIALDREYEAFSAKCAQAVATGALLACHFGTPAHLNSDYKKGIKHRGVVSKTSRGDSLMSTLPKEKIEYAKANGWLYIPVGSFYVGKIVEKAAYRSQGAHWRMVSFFYDATLEPIYKQYTARLGEPVADKRKGRVLLKYDPFKSTWAVVARDYANADSEFRTENVPRMVQELESK